MLGLVVGVGGMRMGGLVGIEVVHGTLVDYFVRRKGRWANTVVVSAPVAGRDQVKQIMEVKWLLQTARPEDMAKVVVELQHSP